jgi:hypothetical protein
MTTIKAGINIFDPPSGMLRAGSIVDSSGNEFRVQLTEVNAIRGKAPSVGIPRVFPLIDSAGMFIGSLPAKNTPVTVAQSLGGQYHFVNYEPENRNIIPKLLPGQMLIRSSDSSKILLDLDSNIKIGSDVNNIHVFAGSQKYPKSNLVTFNFENENHFTQAYREVGGLVKRDLQPNPQAASYSGSTKLEDDAYDPIYSVIGLDPTSTANDIRTGPTKNPAFVEHRQIVYEFQLGSNIDDLNSESNKYTTTAQAAKVYSTPNRRSSRADTMSLSSVAPNFLIEEVKGTVVDIFGNILDLNRLPLPIGLTADTTLRTNGTVATTDSKKSYLNIRALERKSVAFHFEINSRKDPKPTNQGTALGINDDNYNAKLQRSRFSFDVDKEGQFKLNVPASSETGNIPLLVRPENYSTFATTDNSNPNQLWFPKSGQPVSQDIFVDSFAAPMLETSAADVGGKPQFLHGSIQLIDGTNNNDAGPHDRISQFVAKSVYSIRHGTAYHDILKTCSLHQDGRTIENYQLQTMEDPIDTSYIKDLSDLVSTKIKVSGPDAKAGGRSGSINLDGSLEMNIGANTIDRQSLWLDTAGGMVANIGRDRNNRSAMVNFDGDVFVQVGGFGIAASDARFKGKDDTWIATMDLRVFAGGYAHMFRVDAKGVTIMTPSVLNLYGAQGINMKSDGPIYIDADNLYVNHRLVALLPATSV